MIAKLHAATVKVLACPAVKEHFASFGTDAFSSTPEQLGAFIQKDFAKWTKVVKRRERAGGLKRSVRSLL